MTVMVRREWGCGKGRHGRLSWWHGASEGILKHALSSWVLTRIVVRPRKPAVLSSLTWGCPLPASWRSRSGAGYRCYLIATDTDVSQVLTGQGDDDRLVRRPGGSAIVRRPEEQ
jgi:hypothetical protein